MWCAVNLPVMAAFARCSSISVTCCRTKRSLPTEGDPAQYALAQLRLPQAHALARGMNVTIAVIDSGIDANHPELANAIADSFDALGSKEGPHVHGTGIAGAIAAHARLMGSAPEVRILAIRAFGASASGAQSTSYVILKGLDYAALHGAQIVNMSFAGPKDSLIERAVAATAARGIVLIAAAGNAGAKIAAALSGRQSERDRGQRHRRPGKTVLRLRTAATISRSPRPAPISSCPRPTANTR